jgi:N-acetylglucosaminyl-diphospho-decaprenol L-rhamnosyltransferase
LRAFPPQGKFEVFVIDNASSDGSAAMVQAEFPEFRLIASSKNMGYAEGNNLGFAAAKGDKIVTLNPDTEVNSSTFERPREILESNPQVGCVGIKQIGLDGRVQPSVRGFPTSLGILGDLLRLRFARFDSYRLSRFDYEKEQTAPQPMGTFLMFRRSALARIGDPTKPFDVQFPIFFNEVDLLYQLERAGFLCIYTPLASILHHGGESTKQIRPKMIWESHRSLLRFFSKHASSTTQKIGVAMLTPVIYAGAFVRARGYDAGFRT